MDIFKKLSYALSIGVVLLLSACGEKDPVPTPEGSVAKNIQLINEFAEGLMTNYYLWNNEAKQVISAQNLNTKTEPDPIEFYDKLVHQDDRWSFMTDDVESLNQSLSGTMTTFGYSLIFGRFVDSNGSPTGDVYAIVQYVYPDSPAERAGLARGDYILRIDGRNITVTNYTDLYYASSLNIGLGVVNGQYLEPNGTSVSITAVEMYEDPIVHHSIIEKGGKRIGYLFYTDYILDRIPGDSQSLYDLENVFATFKAAGVDDVVLDLRYNGGGYAFTSNFLCNLLAPKSALDNKDIMLVQKWNSILDPEMGESLRYGHSVKRTVNGTEMEIPITSNMNLTRLFVLTGNNTASASESTIVSLKPYLDLIQIGQTTSGKYCGGIVFDRSIILKDKAPDMWSALGDNWGAYTMVYKFTNKNNATFVNGFTPQYIVNEHAEPFYPLGDEDDPLLGKAVELITGIPRTRGDIMTRSIENISLTPLPDARMKANRLDGKMIDVIK